MYYAPLYNHVDGNNYNKLFQKKNTIILLFIIMVKKFTKKVYTRNMRDIFATKWMITKNQDMLNRKIFFSNQN